MEFDIDVSGEDIFNRDYTIVVADKNGLVRGYKFDLKTLQILMAREGEGKYRYALSRQGRSLRRVRLYCIILHYIFREIVKKIDKKEIVLNVCKDFQGHEKDITSNLNYFLGDLLGLKITVRYGKLPDESPAHEYAYLMRKDKSNLMNGYVKITIEEMEKYLNKQ